MRSLFLALLGLVVVCSAEKLKCGKCNKDACPPVSCLSGKTLDECKCCDVCYKMEGEECNPGLEPVGYGDCGTGLKCANVGDGHFCLCESDEVICGKDGVTYNNICEKYATEARTGEEIEKEKDGPCDPAAKILTGPEFTRNFTNGSVILSCEAIGNPTPYIAWVFTRVDGKTFPMPADDSRILTAARGGPGKFQVTGWLQIEGLQKEHEGDYTCVAKNGDKKVFAKGRVKVKDNEE